MKEASLFFLQNPENSNVEIKQGTHGYLFILTKNNSDAIREKENVQRG